jgi:hypothetical protein
MAMLSFLATRLPSLSSPIAAVGRLWLAVHGVLLPEVTR